MIKETKPHYTPSGRLIRKFLCRCRCGNKKTVQLWHLRSGHTTSCGCEKTRKSITHGKSNTPEIRTWQGMKQRCLNINNNRYKDYGGRGIKVCKRWLKFENFYKDMGERPKGTTLDRIDNNGNYEPSNCRWATPEQQYSNMRSNHYITYNGETLTISQWARKLNVPASRITTRLRRGWDIKRALTEKSNRRSKE